MFKPYAILCGAVSDALDALPAIPENIRARWLLEHALHQAEENEPFAPAKDLLSLLTKNEQIARTTRMPICQDTGMAVVFADVGQDVHIAGDFAEAVNEGVRRGYVEGLLRKSVVGDPLRRVNTGDNTPAVLHTRLVPGDTLTLTVAPKGFGSENMSQLRMLTPASGIDGVKRFVLDTVRAAGANPCPPMVLGIGIGGDFEQVAENAKRALMLPLGTPNPDPFYAQLEAELLEAINQTGIGVQDVPGAAHYRRADAHRGSARRRQRQLPRHAPRDGGAVRGGTHMRKLTTPLTEDDVKSLHAGEHVLLSGVVYTARDAAHLRMMDLIRAGKPLPVDLAGQVIYYAGPTPTPPGRPVGSIGPTTSTRMDSSTPTLLQHGLRGMIGKGSRSPAVMAAMQEYPAVYFAAVGGAAALMAECVTSLEVICWDDLGPESVKRLTLEDLPLVVAADCYGQDAFTLGQKAYLEGQNEA